MSLDARDESHDRPCHPGLSGRDLYDSFTDNLFVLVSSKPFLSIPSVVGSDAWQVGWIMFRRLA